MTKILFICHGNICRSPMAEFIFKDMVHKAGLEGEFEISSAATSREEIGNDIYPPAKQVMRLNGIPFERRRAWQVTADDMAGNDFVVVMDDNNVRNLQRMFGSRFDVKIRKLMDFAGEDRNVSDPWYTDDFDTAFEDIQAGCRGLFERLAEEL